MLGQKETLIGVIKRTATRSLLGVDGKRSLP